MSEKIRSGEAEHVEARRPLELTGELFRQVLDQSRDAIYLADMRACVLQYLSPAAENLTGFTLEELWQMGTAGIQEHMHPDDQERYLEGIRALTEGRRSEAVEYRWLHKDGNYRWFSDSRTMIPGADTRPQFLVGTVRDITERRQAEERQSRQLEEADRERAFLRVLLNSVADGVWFADLQGNFYATNRAATEGVGLERTDEFFQPVPNWRQIEFLTPDGRPRPPEQAPLLRSLRSEIVWEEEIIRHLRTGEQRYRQVCSAGIVHLPVRWEQVGNTIDLQGD